MIRKLSNQKRKRHPMDCETQLTWKCLLRPTFVGERFWPVKWVRLAFFVARSDIISKAVRARLRLCVHRLRFVPQWLTSTHTHTHIRARVQRAFWLAYMISPASWAKNGANILNCAIQLYLLKFLHKIFLKWKTISISAWHALL